jgi:two-component system, LuxR family, sensor kinase FixL
MIYPDMAARRREKIDQVLEAGMALRFDEKSDDNWYDTIIYPVRGRQGLITKLAIFSHDVTETRRMQRDILEISELERQRIGQDLHDSLGQKLTGIAFLAEALKQSMQAKSYPELADMEEIIYNVTDSIDHARKISSGLWTERFRSYDAVRALEELAGDTQSLFRINCSFRSETDEAVVNRTAVTNLYYIARESVNNAIKHGRADRIEITLYDDEEHIFLKIQDNGRGPHVNYDKKRGIGLRIMKYRAGILGGTIHTLATGSGFTILAMVKKEFIRNYLD